MRDIIYCIHCGEVNKLENGICTNCGCFQTKKETLPDEQPAQNTMAQETILPEGIRLFDKHPNAPDFVLASVVISLDELFTFCQKNPQFLADYQNKKQLKLQILRSQKGVIYSAVDTYGTPAQPARQQPAQQPAQSGWGQPVQPVQQQWGAPQQQTAQGGWGQPAQQPAQSGWGAPQQPAHAAQPAAGDLPF